MSFSHNTLPGSAVSSQTAGKSSPHASAVGPQRRIPGRAPPRRARPRKSLGRALHAPGRFTATKRPYSIRLNISGTQVLQHGRALGPLTGYKATISKVTGKHGKIVYEVHTFRTVQHTRRRSDTLAARRYSTSRTRRETLKNT